MIKPWFNIAAALVILLTIPACSTIKGNSVSDKRSYVLKMQRETLNQLYKKHPSSRKEIANSAGFAIFSNINTNIIFVSTSGGYGIAENNRSKQRTFMKMAGFGVGLGAGVRDMRLVMIFNKRHDFESFVDNGWDLSGKAGAAAQSSDQGGHVNAIKSADFDIKTYQLTQAGLSADATVDGSKFWKDEELN